MPRWGMVIDLKRCVGCNACTIACKQEHGTPPDIHFARVVTREVGTYPHAKRTFLPLLCNHCEDAPCERVCPTGATYIRPDGIVMVDADKCIGCRACAVACPYLNRHFIEPGLLQAGYGGNGDLTPFESLKFAAFQEGTMTKCTFCAHRVDQGLEPACVVTCPTEARIFGDLDDPDGRLSRLIEERKGWTLLPECGTKPCVYYLDE
ncbi:MAG: 4Fe-4S dicluster domain-containing protein [Acidobacteria bacterium]|nr:MAG: 4Fe-4S dicluster domain-containing protein [Acidobacteriota bacterium]